MSDFGIARKADVQYYYGDINFEKYFNILAFRFDSNSALIEKHIKTVQDSLASRKFKKGLVVGLALSVVLWTGIISLIVGVLS